MDSASGSRIVRDWKRSRSTSSRERRRDVGRRPRTSIRRSRGFRDVPTREVSDGSACLPIPPRPYSRHGRRDSNPQDREITDRWSPTVSRDALLPYENGRRSGGRRTGALPIELRSRRCGTGGSRTHNPRFDGLRPAAGRVSYDAWPRRVSVRRTRRSGRRDLSYRSRLRVW